MRKGARLEGKVKVTELLIKSVTHNKPKNADRLGPKGKWLVNPVIAWITGTKDHRTIGRT